MSDPWSLDGKLRELILIDIPSGKATTIVHGKRIAAYALSPDGSRIVYTLPKRFERPGSQQILFDLGVVTIAADHVRLVASNIRLGFDGASFSWSPDSLRLAFQAGGVEERTYDCFVVSLEDGSLRNVSMLAAMRKPSYYKGTRPLWGTNGKSVYFLREGVLWQASKGQAGAHKAGRVRGQEIVRLIPKAANLLWTLDGDRSTIVVTHDRFGKQDGFYKIDLGSGETTKLLERGQCYTCTNVSEQFVVARDGQQVAFFAQDARQDSALWVSAPGFESPRRLTHLNPQFDQYELGSARPINWLSTDGARLYGALLLPAGYQKGKRYPLILWVYGGELLSDDCDHFGLVGPGPFNMQLLATRGYAVLLPDAPQHLGTPMIDLAKTVLPGVNKVIEMGIADQDRLGIMGQSYGGYSTLSLIVQTDRFRAAVESDGYADLVGYYGEMDRSGAAFGTSIAEGGQGLIGGQPWQLPSRYFENSPIYYLDRVQTPLLIMHGTEDTTVAPFLGDQVFVGLRRLGKEVEYAKYDGEGHSPPYWSYKNQVDFCNRMMNWFELHLMRANQ
jgi:dipeptidyl aminopeptidase/acylaminoacyl peptidase